MYLLYKIENKFDFDIRHDLLKRNFINLLYEHVQYRYIYSSISFSKNRSKCLARQETIVSQLILKKIQNKL